MSAAVATAVSARKLRANRRNARRSTGPRTFAGKKRSSRNAVTHGLFCEDLVLPGESQELFRAIRQGLIASLKPQNLVELLIVDRLVAATWKLRRLQAAEKIMHGMGVEELMARREEAAEEVAEETNKLAGEDVLDPQKVVEMIEREGVPPGLVLGDKFAREWDQSFDRLARLEQRLDYQVQRCTRELRQLRKDAEKIEALPSSPFLESEPIEPPEEPAQDQGRPPPSSSPSSPPREAQRDTPDAQNEPTARPGGVNSGAANSNDSHGGRLAGREGAAEDLAAAAPHPSPLLKPERTS